MTSLPRCMNTKYMILFGTLSRKEPDQIILHIRTTYAINSTYKTFLDDLLSFKLFIKEKLDKCEVTKGNDNNKASSTCLLVNKKLLQLKIRSY